MNYLVRAPIGPNGLYQWIPCETLSEAFKVARITSHGMGTPPIYRLSDGLDVREMYS